MKLSDETIYVCIAIVVCAILLTALWGG